MLVIKTARVLLQLCSSQLPLCADLCSHFQQQLLLARAAHMELLQLMRSQCLPRRARLAERCLLQMDSHCRGKNERAGSCVMQMMSLL